MANTYWLKQTPNEPLFSDLIWSRPENKQARGKLLVIGGNSQAFMAPAQAYNEASGAGVGSTRVMLPQHVQKLLPKQFSEMEFAPSTPSGSFGRQALAELIEASGWADGVLLAGDFGRNSETSILLEQFIQKYQGQLTLVQDSIDYFVFNPEYLASRPQTLIAPSFTQLQKLATAAKFKKAFTSSMDFLNFVDSLHEFTTEHRLAIITQHLNTDFVAVNGQVSSTKPASDQNDISKAAHASVWWLQNPTKQFEAITTSLADNSAV